MTKCFLIYLNTHNWWHKTSNTFGTLLKCYFVFFFFIDKVPPITYVAEENEQFDSNEEIMYQVNLVNDFEDDRYANQTNSLSNHKIEFTELKIRRFDIMPIFRVSLTYYLR